MSGEPEMSTEPDGQRDAEAQRTGVYWKPSLWALARSAYVADLDRDPGCPDSFVAWLGRALEQHAARTPAQRVAIAEDPQLQDVAGTGVNRSHPLRVRTIELVEFCKICRASGVDPAQALQRFLDAWDEQSRKSAA